MSISNRTRTTAHTIEYRPTSNRTYYTAQHTPEYMSISNRTRTTAHTIEYRPTSNRTYYTAHTIEYMCTSKSASINSDDEEADEATGSLDSSTDTDQPQGAAPHLRSNCKMKLFPQQVQTVQKEQRYNQIQTF